MIKYFVSILSLIQICLAAETITIGCNIEDFSFIEKCSGNPKMLYQISGLRSFPGLDGGNIQTIDHTKMLVGARKDYTTPHNSGFVWDGWLVGGKKHIIQIETASSRDQSVMLYIGYGHKPLEDRVLQEWSEDYFLFFKHRKLTLKSYLGQGYDKHFWQVPLLFPKSQTVTEYEFIAPTSHEKGNTLVPIHIGCAFTNDSLPLKDFFTITNFKVLYFDSMDSIQYLSNQASLNIHHGVRNSPLKDIPQYLLKTGGRMAVSQVIGFPIIFTRMQALSLVFHSTEIGREDMFLTNQLQEPRRPIYSTVARHEPEFRLVDRGHYCDLVPDYNGHRMRYGY